MTLGEKVTSNRPTCSQGSCVTLLGCVSAPTDRHHSDDVFAIGEEITHSQGDPLNVTESQ